MTKSETMMIDEVKYIRADSVSESRNEIKGELYIVVLQRGWVAIGNREVTTNGDYECGGLQRGLAKLQKVGQQQKPFLINAPLLNTTR